MTKKNMKIRDFALEIKAVAEDGTFSGYASVFNNVDSYGDIVAPGAFSDNIKAFNDNNPLVMLWQHNSNQPIGIFTKLVEDDHGLYVEGQLLLDVQAGREAYALLKVKAVSGLSIGYYVKDSSVDEKTRIRTLKEIELFEVSLVTFPANEDARVEGVKMQVAHGQLPETISDFERLMRGIGFSKRNAAIIASSGYKNLLRSDSVAEEKAIEETANLLQTFKIPSFK